MPLKEVDGQLKITFGPNSRISQLVSVYMKKAGEAYMRLAQNKELLDIISEFDYRLDPDKADEIRHYETIGNNPVLLMEWYNRMQIENPEELYSNIEDAQLSLLGLRQGNNLQTGDPKYTTLDHVLERIGILVQQYLDKRLLITKEILQRKQISGETSSKISEAYDRLNGIRQGLSRGYFIFETGEGTTYIYDAQKRVV